MNNEAFTCLYSLLKNGSSFYVHNGPIDGEVYLLMALHFFAGGSYLDIDIPWSRENGLLLIFWCVIHAVNTCPQLQLMFPKSQQDSEDLATEFIGQSQAGFISCVGCIDDMLLWMEKPSKQQCVEAGVDSDKFYCERKGKY